MKKIYSCLITTLFALLILANTLHAQSYINFSKYDGGSGTDDVSIMKVINGETYLLGSTRSANFPVTNGSIYKGGLDITLTKYGVNGAVIYSTYIGGLGNETVTAMQVVNNEVYFTAYTDSINYPVTNGSVFRGLKDAVITKISATGNIAFSSYLGGTGIDFPAYDALQISGNEVFLAGTTGSANFPVTGSSSYHGGISDAFITKLNATDGSVITSLYIGGSGQEYVKNMLFETGSVYLVGSTFSADLPVTIGNPINDNAENGFVGRLNSASLNTIYLRVIGGNAQDVISRAQLVNGVVHIAGYTFSTDYPVTNGTTNSPQPFDIIDGFYTRLGSDGSIIYSTYLSTADKEIINQLVIANGDAYVSGTAANSTNTAANLLIFKIDATGNFIYTKSFSIGYNNPVIPSFEVYNGDLYISGVSFSPDYPISNISQFYSGGTGFFTRLDPSGDIVYSSFLGQMSSMVPMRISNNKFYLLGNTAVLSYPVTDMSVLAGGNDNILVSLQPDGTNVSGSYMGGSGTELASAMEINNGEVYFSGKTTSLNYPVTDNVLYKANGDMFLTKISYCPLNFYTGADSLSPKIQTVCKNGLAEQITGVKTEVPSDSLPAIYLNGIANAQHSIEAAYQWQSANTTTGPWNNIPGAVFKDYRPVLGGIDQYYRRLSFTSANCGSALIHTSDTATVFVNSLTAPVVDAGGPFFTCPGSPINIGGSPTVSGGNLPYISFIWDMGASPDLNPIVSPNSSTIYTLIVTDASGCKQIGQAVVLTYRADAGPDKSNCAGLPVKIGTAPIPGLPGVVYDWQPATDLNNAGIAQPFANPPIVTDYALTLTLPKSGGGTCVTTDTVTVTPVAAPITQNIAGPDRVFCLKDSITLGMPPEAGFNYVWSPGSYLTSNNFSTANYYAGDIIMPIPNPAVINVTAQKGGCSFPDQTVVATIESRAGLDGCGPRLIGLPDRTPNINETYSWTKISGSGDFTGPTDQPQVAVSASSGTATVYGLTVSYNGWNCYDEVTVPPFCTNCTVYIDVNAAYTCPSYSVNGGNVTLIAYSSIANANYTWTPQVGLSNYTGSVVNLTDNITRTYTVTATNVSDTSIHCIGEIFVNDPAFSKPVFPAPDVIACVGLPISIGLPPVAGYTYQWTGNGLSSNLVSNPIATVNVQTQYPVQVADVGGCILKDTVIVAVQNVQVNAGPDIVICSSGIVKLGTPAQPNTSYLWEPQAAPWQNGTDQFSVQPEVFIATNVSFIVTATTPAGCTTKDTVNVIINNSPTIPDAPDKLVCKGSQVMIGSTALPGVTYQWTPVTGLNNPAIAQPLASPAINTVYTVVATFPGACAFPASDQVFVTVSDATFQMPDISFCPANGPVALGNNAPVGLTAYSWQPAQLVTNPTIANPSTLTPPPNITTVFTLQVTNGDGCKYRDTIAIIPSISLPAAGPDKLICKNQSTTIGSASNATGPNISYSWQPTVNLSDPLSPNPIFTGTTGGLFTYVLIKTDISVSCSSRDTVVIKVVDSLLPAINSSTICTNGCVQIGPSPVAGLQYQWAPATGLSNPNIANPLACVGTVTTAYLLTATDLNGCSSSANVIIIVSSDLSPQINLPPVTACVGDTNAMFNPVVNPAGSYSYLWSPDNGTLSDINIANPEILITGTGNTQYILQVTNNTSGCTNTAVGNLDVSVCPAIVTIGDFIWFDTNSDGIQDAGELGVSGMSVKLYNSAGFNVASTITDPNGYYYFTGIAPGNDYYVIFSKPAGYIFTLQNIGGSTASNNSKADTFGISNNFNVLSGLSNLDIDAGIKADGSVPVTLLSFTGSLHDKKVYLHWQTTAEYNNDFFDVQKSINANNFTAIGRVDGHGTTVLPHNYSLVDPHPVVGINYYRLKQVDYDGHASYSQIVPIQLNEDEIISAYYNNQNNSIQLAIGEQQENINAKLFAANGQLVSQVKIKDNTSTYTWQLPALASGIYMLQLRNDKINYSREMLLSR